MPIDRPEFQRMKLNNFPEDVIKQHGLREKVNAKSFVILQVEKGMYGLLHTGIIAQDLLTKWLSNAEYRQSDKSPGFGNTTRSPSVLP